MPAALPERWRPLIARNNNAGMIVWLNEAAGKHSRIIGAAIHAMAERESRKTEAKYGRLILPWDRVAKLLVQKARAVVWWPLPCVS